MSTFEAEHILTSDKFMNWLDTKEGKQWLKSFEIEVKEDNTK